MLFTRDPSCYSHEILPELLQAREEGLTYQQLATWLNENGVTTFGSGDAVVATCFYQKGINLVEIIQSVFIFLRGVYYTTRLEAFFLFR